jgi:hypothetical protein
VGFVVPGLAPACSGGGEDLLIGGLEGRAEEGESDEAVNWTASDVMDLNLQLAEGTQFGSVPDPHLDPLVTLTSADPDSDPSFFL